MSKLAHVLSLALFMALTVWTTAPAEAQEVRPFSSRFQANEAGDLRLIGNTLVSCSPALSASCTSARSLAGTPDVHNNDDFMVDVDNDPATFNSSTATATLPPGAPALSGAHTVADLQISQGFSSHGGLGVVCAPRRGASA